MYFGTRCLNIQVAVGHDEKPMSNISFSKTPLKNCYKPLWNTQVLTNNKYNDKLGLALRNFFVLTSNF